MNDAKKEIQIYFSNFMNFLWIFLWKKQFCEFFSCLAPVPSRLPPPVRSMPSLLHGPPRCWPSPHGCAMLKSHQSRCPMPARWRERRIWPERGSARQRCRAGIRPVPTGCRREWAVCERDRVKKREIGKKGRNKKWKKNFLLGKKM